MQQYVDDPVVINRDEDHFKMTTFLKTSGCDRKNKTPSVMLTFANDARYIVDEIAGVKNINSSVIFGLFLEEPSYAREVVCAIDLTFSHS